MPHKRYMKIVMEYDMDLSPLRLASFIVFDNIKRVLAEDMPYVKVLSMKDCPTIEALDK